MNALLLLSWNSEEFLNKEHYIFIFHWLCVVIDRIKPVDDINVENPFSESERDWLGIAVSYVLTWIIGDTMYKADKQQGFTV